MKNFMICLLMASFITNISFAADSETICAGMRESTQRNNPKADKPLVQTKAGKKGVREM